MTTDNKNWNSLHNFYQKQDWIDLPNIFAKEAIKHLKKSAHILELGSGQGQDTRYFAQKGFQVTSTDISDKALELSKQKLPEKLKSKVNFLQMDMNKPFPIKDNEFDVVYAHLSFHYFKLQDSEKIVKEIYRVIKPGGILAMLNNTKTDPEYGSGEEIEADYFIIEDKQKRFFSPESLGSLVSDFKTLILDDKGETYKDAEKGIHNLIRFIGVK